MHSFDVELTPQEIQSISSPDAVASFFAKLGYDTTARTNQTVANLAIPEAAARPIKRIELIADHKKQLQVYLFELTSVTVAEIKALARAFRNRAGQFLLVLTSDYEFLEFVLLDRELSEPKGPTAISTALPTLVQRRFSVDRRRPTAVHLRVLRRFTWTEADPFGQFDKLRYAYDLAHWSEPHFNNHALFSDYYLRERLPARDGKDVEFPEWREDPKPAYQRLRSIYEQPAERFAGRKTSELIGLLYEPLLRELGFKPTLQSSGDSGLHLRLEDPKSGALLGICLPYPWGRELDRKDEMHDTETPEVTPTFAVVDLLAKEKTPWVVLTNGKLWRLYSQRAHSRATNYYEIDLDEVLGRQGFQQDIQDAFRYFWLLFRVQAFRPVERDWQGKRQALSMLDRLLLGSEEYAKELGENLKNRVFTEVFPVLAEGFIASMRQRGETDLDDYMLGTVFQGTLTLLYRLLFLLYAESRDLLPVHAREYRESSLRHLKEEIKEIAGTIADETERHINKHYAADSHDLWKRLKSLFHVIDQGSEELNVPCYNGGLFLAERHKDDRSPEAEAARFLERERVVDRYLARAIDLLARVIDPKRYDLVSVDYKSLGVRQLGSIYEGLLEFRVRIAGEKLAVVKEKGREVYSPFKDLSGREKTKVENQGSYVSRGHVYLENDKRERKATGSYYTPDHIVKYIVEHAVGPVLQDKFDGLRPKLREAQRERREFFKQQEAFTKRGMKPKAGEQADLIGQDLVDELFNIKVLDPAMGSGHFLVEAVDYITDKTLEFLNGFPWNPVLVHLEKMRNTIQEQMDQQNIDIDAKRLTDVNLLKRHVLKRCIYGVDLNPMALELAKVSLWLDCFTLGAPLSFLDHHLRWGNSLIGSTMAEVDAIRTAKDVQLPLTATSDWQGLAQAVQAMVDVGGMPDITANQVANSKKHFQSALADVETFKRVLDLHTARWFVESSNLNARSKKSKTNIFDEMLRSGELFEWAHGRVVSPVAHSALARNGREAVEEAAVAAEEKRFFHWELEFPEVFHGRRPGTQNAVERLNSGGFDAVIGNPPYLVVGNYECLFSAFLEFVDFDTSSLDYLAKRSTFAVDERKSLFGVGAAYGLTFPENCSYTLPVLAAILNSKLINRRFTAISPEFQAGHKFNESYVEQLPIAKIEFRSSTSDRQHAIRMLLSECEQSQRSGVFSDLLAQIGGIDHPLRIRQEVVHDLISELSTQMAAMAITFEKNLVSFLSWIVENGSIRTDEQNRQGIDALVGKTALKSLVSAFDEPEQRLSFEEMWEVLERNASRIANLRGARFKSKAHEAYSAAIERASSVRRMLVTTDKIIDALVYRLYGLNSKEVTVDANEDARRFLEGMAAVDPTQYDLRKLHRAVQHDVHVLTEVWNRVKGIDAKHDTKLLRLKKLLIEDLKNQKVLIFSYYKDTARYLYRHLGDPDNPDAVKFLKQAGDIVVRRMDSGNHPDERVKTVQAFAPKANGKPDWVGTDREIDVLISTDVLSEGQNLQDCGYLLNYDLHWNPTRMVQRAGRIDRIGTDFDILWIYNMFPDRGLERLLGLVNGLSRKIANIDRLGMLDASVLGEEVHPQTFNTLKRIREEDNSVIEEEEQFMELASGEVLLQQLRAFLDSGGRNALEQIPNGIHSGLQRAGARGIFFYFRSENSGKAQSFWKYFDLKSNRILDNRHVLANLIACSYDTPRIVDQEIYRSVFALQEKVVENLLQCYEEKTALQTTPQAIDPLQQTISTVVQQFLNHPLVERKRAIAAIEFLNGPMQNVQVSELRKIYKAYQQTQSIAELISAIETMRSAYGVAIALLAGEAEKPLPKLKREDLRLICFDVLSESG